MNETPGATVMDHLRFTATTNQLRHETSSGITLIQAAGQAGEAEPREQELYSSLDELLADLRGEHEYVLIDAPAGTGRAVRWALDRADLRLLVVVGEPTAIADAYRLARMIWSTDPFHPLATVVNFAESSVDGESVADRFARITEHFTGRLPNYLGWVPFSHSIRQSVMQQIPVVRKNGPASEAFRMLADAIIKGRTPLVESVESR